MRKNSSSTRYSKSSPKSNEHGYVLLATTMMVILLAVLTAAMVRESGSSSRLAQFSLKSISEMELAKYSQTYCVQLAVRVKNNILNQTSSDQLDLIIPDIGYLTQSLEESNDMSTSFFDLAIGGKQPYVVLGDLVAFIDVDWQGDYKSDKGKSKFDYNNGGGAGWDFFGNAGFGSGGQEVSVDGGIKDASRESSNYELYSCQTVLQKVTTNATGAVANPQTFDPSQPFMEYIGTYKYDYVRTPPTDF